MKKGTELPDSLSILYLNITVSETFMLSKVVNYMGQGGCAF